MQKSRRARAAAPPPAEDVFLAGTADRVDGSACRIQRFGKTAATGGASPHRAHPTTGATLADALDFWTCVWVLFASAQLRLARSL